MKVNNYKLLFIAKASKLLGRGKYFRKKLYNPARILYLNFPEDSSFSFVQVGANDGISFDFLYSFVTKRKAAVGIAIEPVREYFEELKSNYSDCKMVRVVNKAVFESK